MSFMQTLSNENHSPIKNFNTLLSLLLMGLGVGLVLIPQHLGMAEYEDVGALHFFVGGLGFFVALLYQATSVWETTRQRALLIQSVGAVLLLVAGGMLLKAGQIVSAVVLMIGAMMQGVLLLPWQGAFFRQNNPTQLTISLMTFSAGISLPVARYEFPGAEFLVPLLAVTFLLTAFVAGISIAIPALQFGYGLSRLQTVPWLLTGLLFLVLGKDNVIAPSAIVGMLILERFIPWDRLIVPTEDVISRRVILIAAFSELSIFVFLGALLYAIRPDHIINIFIPVSIRHTALIFFSLFSLMTYYAVFTVIMTINGLMRELYRTDSGESDDVIGDDFENWDERVQRYLRPYIMSPHGIRGRVQADQIKTLLHQNLVEKKRNAQLTLLLELSQQLETQLDQPVSAQLAVNMLERALSCGMVTIFLNEPATHHFVLLAAAGRHISLIPEKYKQDASKGIIGRTLRQRKTQVVNNIRLDPEYLPFRADDNSQSLVIIPLIHNGHIHGMIALNSEKNGFFGSLEVALAESVASELARAWARSGYHQRLKELIQTGSTLSAAPDPETATQEVASIARDIVQAKFTYIYIQLGEDRSYILQAFSGNAQKLQTSLGSSQASSELLRMALNATQPFRIRDVRKYKTTEHLIIDNPGLRSLLAIPIRWHHANIGVIFAFGKQKEVFFTENDESLAELISIQASGTFESTWLQKELRSSLRITSLLYRLSTQIIQAETIEDAAAVIAQTAHKLNKNLSTGIVLFTLENIVLAETRIDEPQHTALSESPLTLIRNSIQLGRSLTESPAASIIRTCLPIRTPLRTYGAIWMDAQDTPEKPFSSPADLQALVTQAAIALERSLLLVESRRQAKEIQAAYDTLEDTYDQTLASLTSALDARDRETEGHSVRVTHLAFKLGEYLGYSAEQLKILERGSLLHDIGKIGISDNILHKPGPLNESEWKTMRQHPDIGARIVEGIPFLQDTIPIIRHHQERWDGTGYPAGLRGEEIPVLARLFAIIDAFDALTSNRPYRTKITIAEALEYIREQAGILFDPQLARAFEEMIKNDPTLIQGVQ